LGKFGEKWGKMRRKVSFGGLMEVVYVLATQTKRLSYNKQCCNGKYHILVHRGKVFENNRLLEEKKKGRLSLSKRCNENKMNFRNKVINLNLMGHFGYELAPL